MLAFGHIGYRKHYTADSKSSSDSQNFHAKSHAPLFSFFPPQEFRILASENKNSELNPRGNTLFEKCMLCILERQTRSFLAFEGKTTLLSYCPGSLAEEQLPSPAGSNVSSQGDFFLAHQPGPFSNKIMLFYSMLLLTTEYLKLLCNYHNLLQHVLRIEEL